MTNFKVGDKVAVNHPRYPGLWVVEKMGPVNSTLTPVAGGRGLKAPHTMLRSPGDTGTVQAVPLQEYFMPGEFVRIKSGKFAGLYIVLADKGMKVNVVEPGGNNGTYVRALKSSLTKVPASDVLRTDASK